jgi:hypothetical protein
LQFVQQQPVAEQPPPPSALEEEEQQQQQQQQQGGGQQQQQQQSTDMEVESVEDTVPAGATEASANSLATQQIEIQPNDSTLNNASATNSGQAASDFSVDQPVFFIEVESGISGWLIVNTIEGAATRVGTPADFFNDGLIRARCTPPLPPPLHIMYLG